MSKAQCFHLIFLTDVGLTTSGCKIPEKLGETTETIPDRHDDWLFTTITAAKIDPESRLRLFLSFLQVLRGRIVEENKKTL